MLRRILITGALALALITPAAAQTEPDWRQAATDDLDAAYRLVRDNHPGAAPELGDTAFVAALEGSYAQSKAMLGQVSTRGGYLAVLRRFAVGLGDKHIQLQPTKGSVTDASWPGFLSSLRGDRWIVSGQEPLPGEPELNGAEVVSCDGVAVAKLAEDRIGRFNAVWRIAAQRRLSAWRLFVDAGNPFLSRIRTCRFHTEQGERDVTLNWRPVTLEKLQSVVIATAGIGRPGFGVRKVGDAWWIALESLDDNAQPVVAEVLRQAAVLKQAPLLVIDLRGNGGGSSYYGDQIAQALYGREAVRKAAARMPRGCGPRWRATPGNLAAMREFTAREAPSRGPEMVRQWTADGDRIEAAVRSGQPFDRPLEAGCLAPARDLAAPKQPADLKARVVVLTDSACFSSCLLVVQEFRSLGAQQLGQETDAGTRYMEIRFADLPSGLARFSTLQKVDTGSPPEIGPFAPSIAYDGNMSDTAALEAWVAKIAVAS